MVSTIPTLISGVAALAAAYFGYRNYQQLIQIKVEINHRLSQLLELTVKSSHAEGVLQEREKKE